MANKYWKAIVSLLMAKSPNTHVRPSRGSKTIMPLTPALQEKLHTMREEDLYKSLGLTIKLKGYTGIQKKILKPTGLK